MNKKKEEKDLGVGYILHKGMKFEVNVQDTREKFGRVEFLIAPRCGTGSAWVDTKNLFPAGDGPMA